MGISTTAARGTDAQIRSYIDDPGAADELFDGCATAVSGFCHLHDHWAGLHFLLTGDPEGGELPLAAIRRGDVEYSGVCDPIHAIYASTTVALAAALDSLTDATLRARFDPGRMMKAARGGRPIYPGRLWAFPGHGEETFRSLLCYRDRLRDFTDGAARDGDGLLFCRHEDF